jgi:hypothetical protein
MFYTKIPRDDFESRNARGHYKVHMDDWRKCMGCFVGQSRLRYWLLQRLAYFS